MLNSSAAMPRDLAAKKCPISCVRIANARTNRLPTGEPKLIRDEAIELLSSVDDDIDIASVAVEATTSATADGVACDFLLHLCELRKGFLCFANESLD